MTPIGIGPQGPSQMIFKVLLKIFDAHSSFVFFQFFFAFAGILAFPTPGLGSYLMKATASYLYEGLVAAASEDNL